MEHSLPEDFRWGGATLPPESVRGGEGTPASPPCIRAWFVIFVTDFIDVNDLKNLNKQRYAKELSFSLKLQYYIPYNFSTSLCIPLIFQT